MLLVMQSWVENVFEALRLVGVIPHRFKLSFNLGTARPQNCYAFATRQLVDFLYVCYVFYDSFFYKCIACILHNE